MKISLLEGSGLVFTGKIRDPLHDTIPITAAEKAVIDTPEFQRLRRIQQTAFIKYVFPGATHTRFEHSLGVMHMSGIMANSLVFNQKRILADVDAIIGQLASQVRAEFYKREEQDGSVLDTRDALTALETNPYLTQCLRFAALLHDLGHAPFSHSGERFLPTWQQLALALEGLDIPEYLKTGLAKKCEKVMSKTPHARNIAIRHEIYTLLIIARLFNNETNPHLSKQMGQDICAVLDLSIEPAAGSPLASSGLHTLLHEVVSGELDVDRMDYLMRDSRQCGVVYGLFDAARILDSACFYFDRHTQKYHLAMRKRGVPALEDYLRARWSMYQQVYFHKTATACEAMLEAIHRQLGKFTFPLEVKEYLELDDSSFYAYIAEKNPKRSAQTDTLLRDLVFNRKLWKRVYEESTPRNSSVHIPSLCPTIQMFLKKNNIPNEMIESGTSLTRFSPKGRSNRSENTLRVVIKDVHGLRFLEPIEHHSSLVNRMDEETLIRRIFVSGTKTDGSPIASRDIQKLLSQGVITPSVD